MGDFYSFFRYLLEGLVRACFSTRFGAEFSCFFKDSGHSFVTFLKVLESSSGNDETLKFDDSFMNLMIFLN